MSHGKSQTTPGWGGIAEAISFADTNTNLDADADANGRKTLVQ